MHAPIEFAVADREFYAPLAESRPDDDVLGPRAVPPAWTSGRAGLWRMWQPTGHRAVVDDGWKVHVSARQDRVEQVLDVVAEVCFAHGIAFKHLATRQFYFWLHHKHASRVQNGKFVAAYPPDEHSARALMERLRSDLAAEEGPYILTDRPYRDSSTVFYRYGGFTPRFRHQADGTQLSLTRDGRGRLVPDERGPAFRLPDGITDPFVEATPEALTPTDLNGFVVESAVRFTNGGGLYRGREVATGRRVFIKEARPHVGVHPDGATAIEQLRQEWATLTALHQRSPGLAPEPIAHFSAWTHEFLVMEHLDGMEFGAWIAKNLPLLAADATEADFADFYACAEQILSGVERDLQRLHALGYLFVDMSPSNVLLADDGSVRLIDFGAAHRLGEPFTVEGTPGYVPPKTLVGDDLTVHDDFGLSMLAQNCFGPMQLVLAANPDALAHLHQEVSESAPIPPGLWARATKFYTPRGHERYPTPEQVAADPIGQLARLRDQVADALVAMADLTHPGRVFPTIPKGYNSNTICVAYGTAGVVHALRRADRALPDGLLDRLRVDAFAKAEALGPGLYVGLAGIAHVLSECGLLDEARDLLGVADRHPFTGECATLFAGSAGVALTHLALYDRTGDARHLERAAAIAATIPDDDTLTAQLGANDATGLMHGRCGIALMLAQLGAVTGDGRYGARAVRLLHAELDRAVDPASPALLFPGSRKDARALPYLAIGSAGLAYTATRCLQTTADERLAEALPRLLAPVRLQYTVMPGLFLGLAGYAFTLADHAALTGDTSTGGISAGGISAGDNSTGEAALRAARALFKHAVPHATGIRFRGDQLLRYSAELWSGSAGVLLALTHVLDPRPDALFTVDGLIAAQRKPAAPATRSLPALVG